MNIQIFSLPQQFVIPHQDWLKTPDVDARVNQAVRSYFANWTINQLSWGKTLSAIACWISLAGVAVAGYLGFAVASSTGRVWDILYFPRILAISGLSFVVCLIGYKAVRRELIARLEKKCLAVEDWLIPLKTTFEELEPLLASFKDQVPPNPPIPFATYQSLYDLLKQLPASHVEVAQSIESFANELDILHLALFGDLRRFGQGEQLTNYWIQYNFQLKLDTHLNNFYSYIDVFQDYFAKLQQDPQNIQRQKNMYGVTHLLYRNDKPANKLSTTDLLEQSRQSIAAFRSSLR